MLPHLGVAEILARLALAAGLGGVIGIERELRDRYAGLRTHLLVAIGSALFTLVSAYAWTGFHFAGAIGYDPTRIAAQIVTGVGFLGAGAIIRQGVTVHGLTTADVELERDSRIGDVVDGLLALEGVTGAQWVH